MADLPEEARAFLNHNPDLRAIDAFFPDLNGILRGKRLAAAELAKAYDGIGINRAALLLDPRGVTLDGGGIGFSDGDPDLIARAIPGTLVRAPWDPTGAGQILLSVAEASGAPIPFDPRTVLQRVAARFGELGLAPRTALELEFYLIDSESDGERPSPPRSPKTGRRHAIGQVYGMAEIEEFGPLLREIADAADIQGIKTGTAVKEYGVGQFEINFGTHRDMLRAADEAVLFQRIVRRVAVKHALRATFMAKPYPDQSGSGLHVHVSLENGAGENIFARDEAALRHAIGGVLETLPESVALLAPNPNSYRRLQPQNFVPVNRSWGYDNRSTALRVPSGDIANRRIEHRLAGADANPYLALAAVLAGVHLGLTKSCDPGAPAKGNAGGIIDSGMPRRWTRALDAMETARHLPDYFGAEFWRVYRLTKEAELDAFEAEASPAEYRLYLMSE